MTLREAIRDSARAAIGQPGRSKPIVYPTATRGGTPVPLTRFHPDGSQVTRWVSPAGSVHDTREAAEADTTTR